MIRRIYLMWRAVAVLLVLMLVLSFFATSSITQAAGERTQLPETYMDPIPARLNVVDVLAPITGTSLEGATGMGYDVVDIEILVRRDIDGWYWNDGGSIWQATAPVWNPIGGVTAELWTTDQWSWVWTPTWAPADFRAGWSYTIWARAVDADGYVDPNPATDTFIYDDEEPDVSFTTNLPATIYSLTQITGTAHDDCGDIGGVIEQVRMLIYDSDNSQYWNGHYWQTDPVWIKCQGTDSWSISTSTDPRLPDWQNNVNYELWVQASDNADNRDFDPIGGFPGAGYAFLYRHDISSTAGCYLDLLPPAASVMTNVYGTSDALPLQNIVNVYVEVKDTTDNVFWSHIAGDWAGSLVDWATDCIPAAIVYDPTYAQWDWDCDLAAEGVTFTHGHTYQVRAQAVDDSATPKTYISGTDSFLYDIIIPAQSNIVAFDDKVYNAWNVLNGNSEDDAKGKLAATIVHIQRTSDGLYWNGLHWGAACWGCADPGGDWDWMFADGSFGTQAHVDWSLSRTASAKYPLPPMVNDEEYTITAFTFDLASNMEATATKVFEFRMDLSDYEGPIPTTPPPPTTTPGPTTPPVPTSTTVPTSPPGPTTPPGPTATSVPPEETATPTVPSTAFSGSANVGTTGGTVTAKDGSGSTRVTAAFDSGAFSSSTAVSIYGSGTCSGMGTAPSGYSFGSSCFTVTPAGSLGADVKLCVYYTNTDKAAGGNDANNLVLAYKDSSGKWVILNTDVNTAAGTICAETNYIGTIAVLGKVAGEDGGWAWWYYLLIALGALLVIAIIVLILVRPKGEGAEMGEGEAEVYAEEEEEL